MKERHFPFCLLGDFCEVTEDGFYPVGEIFLMEYNANLLIEYDVVIMRYVSKCWYFAYANARISNAVIFL
ncbi:hypothetical protein B9Y76_02885 [Stenotrophomonas maltophilia]|nr:hypothetical protein B9Y76_02885 [Stenotrophomonas maltophilia]